MNLTSIDPSTRALSSPSQDKTTSGTEPETPSAGQDFGAVLNTLLGQLVPPTATPAPHISGTDAEALATSGSETGLMGLDPSATNPAAVASPMLLTAFHLGPHLQVITPQTAAPEGQSLEMFARSQGLDEAALQWLMGAQTLTQSPTSLAPEGAGAMATGTLAATATATATGTGTATLTGTGIGTSPLAVSPAEGLLAGTRADGANAALAGLGLKTDAGWRESAPGGTAPTGRQAPLDALSISVTALKPDPAADLGKAQPAWTAITASASDWLKNNTLGLKNMQANATSKLEPTVKSLDLSSLVTPELHAILEQLSSGESASGQEQNPQGQGHFSGRAELTALARSEASGNASALPEMDSAQRRELLNNLAEKMGHAIGQRILSELERGQWHLKLSLRPATLGHIEVEMRMRSGEMDAVFTAGQALTRELLNEGMSKLKDSLNQMGMDVASLKVEDGQNRQRGGDPTPDRQANVRENAPTESADTAAPPPVPVITKMGADGWDVLV